MGFLKKLGKFGQSVIDFGRGKRGLGNVVGTASEAVLGSHNFIANIARSTDKDITSAVNKIGGWDNLALMAGSLLLGPAGTALTTGSGWLAGTKFAAGLAKVGGWLGAAEGASALSTTSSIVGAVGAGYTGRQEYKAIEQEKEDAAAYAKANAEYNAKVAAEEEKARQARRAGLLATKKSLTKNITKGYQGGSGGATSTDLNVGSIVLG